MRRLYHHFGDKEGLLATVLDEAFAAYVGHKRTVARTGDLVEGFCAGWDMHVRFGLENPLLYPLMFASTHPRGAAVTARAAEELARELREMDDAGLLRVSVEHGVALTLAASTGCVLQLLRDDADGTSATSILMRDALLHQLCGPTTPLDRGGAARTMLRHLPGVESTLGREETALLRSWLARVVADA